MRRLYLCGGFLGSGKTTAICQASLVLSQKKQRVAVITNDQGVRLVDGALARELGLPGTEVKGGCFCCRYEELEAAIRSLDHDQGPAVVFAESVGSCTDIVATVVKPLGERYPSLKVFLTVFLDARLLAETARGKNPFDDPNLNYIYFSQPQEADLVIINKADLLTRSDHESVRAYVTGLFPGKTLLFQHSLTPSGVTGWLRALESLPMTPDRKSLEINYETYGAGEASLGWLDEELEIYSSDGGAIGVATELVNLIYEGVCRRGYPIGHLKFLLQEATWHRKISFTSLTEPRLRQTDSPLHLDHLKLLINARVQCPPEKLQEIVAAAKSALGQGGSPRILSRGAEAFRPGYPRPTYRIC